MSLNCMAPFEPELAPHVTINIVEMITFRNSSQRVISHIANYAEI